MDPLLGEIRMFAGAFPPIGWAFCDGTILPISQYVALFAVIGAIYGGDGNTTFQLPDLRGRVPLHVGGSAGAGLSAHTLGQKSGLETTTLTEANLPSHIHSITSTSSGSSSADLKVYNGVGDVNTPSSAKSIAGIVKVGVNEGNTLSTNDANTVISGAVTNIQSTIPSETGSAGSGEVFNNMQPYLGMNYIIAINGIFPTRP